MYTTFVSGVNLLELQKALSNVKVHVCKFCSKKLPMLLANVACHVLNNHKKEVASSTRYFDLFYSDIEKEWKLQSKGTVITNNDNDDNMNDDETELEFQSHNSDDAINAATSEVNPLSMQKKETIMPEANLPRIVSVIGSDALVIHGERTQDLTRQDAEESNGAKSNSGSMSHMSMKEIAKSSPVQITDRSIDNGDLKREGRASDEIDISAEAVEELVMNVHGQISNNARAGDFDTTETMDSNSSTERELDNIGINDNFEQIIVSNSNNSMPSLSTNSSAMFACPKCDSNCIFFVSFEATVIHIKEQHGDVGIPIRLNV